MNEIAYLKMGIAVATVIGLVQWFVSQVEKKTAEDRRKLDHAMAELRGKAGALAREDEAKVLGVLAHLLNEPLERLRPDVNFVDDLRVPPGEMHGVFDELEERYGVMIPRDRIRTCGDLLSVLCGSPSAT